MECVSTVHFSIFANGEKRASFKPSCGLRQGDPLSPYLFLLVAETLSKLIDQGLANQDFSGIKMHRHCPILSHLFFADDVLLFFRAHHTECLNMLRTLHVYSSASGQLINLGKSEVFFSTNASQELQAQLCTLMGIPLASSKVKCLGLPSWWGRSKAEAYGFLIDRMSAKIQG